VGDDCHSAGPDAVASIEDPGGGHSAGDHHGRAPMISRPLVDFLTSANSGAILGAVVATILVVFLVLLTRNATNKRHRR
jgi:hypothetical protein